MIDNLANLQLSPEEMRLVSDPGWILTKNSILQKVVGMMGELAGEYREIWNLAGTDLAGGPNSGAPGRVGIAATDLAGGPSSGVAIGGIRPGDPKVSRGENYRGLPWVMLDFPRVFGREDVLAIRTMFWWGSGFNVTLHLKGVYQQLYLPVILSRQAELEAAGFHVGIHPDEWRHEHTGEVYQPFGGAEVLGGDVLGVDLLGEGPASVSREPGQGREFFKLSAAVGLDRWAEAPELLAGLFGILVRMLRA